MIPESKKLLDDMHLELEDIARSQAPVTEIAWRCLLTTMRHLIAYKKKFADFDFSDTGNQIYFYKKVQPAYFQELFYFFDLLNITSTALQKEPAAIPAYYQEQLDRMELYLGKHSFFRAYLAEHRAHLDDILFIQPSPEVSVYPDNDDYGDASFFNFNSFVLAKIAGYERLAVYLKDQLTVELTSTIRSQERPDINLFFSMLREDPEVSSLYEEMKRKMSWLQSAPQEGIAGYLTIIRERKHAERQLWQTLRNKYLQRHDQQQ